MESAGSRWTLPQAGIIGLSLVVLAGALVLWQEQHLGLRYVEGEQLARHQGVLNGAAPNPWRYRVLSEWLAAAFAEGARIFGVSRPVAAGFLSLRALQNLAIFLLALNLYLRLGLDRREALIGVALLAFAFSHALDNSDLSFNTYSDVLLYLSAALLVLSGRTRAFLGVVALAALNRETSALMVAFPLAPWLAHPRRRPPDLSRRVRVSAAGGTIWLGVFIGLRLARGTSSELGWRQQWHLPGPLEHVMAQLSTPHTLMLLVLTLSILPVLALWKFGRLPDTLKGLFWIVVPVWMIVHLTSAMANETRLFLVPVALVVIPAALYRREGVESPPARPPTGSDVFAEVTEEVWRSWSAERDVTGPPSR
jgi:hypothetical protein